MPITLTPTEPGGFIGLGLPIQLQSDFIGPFPSGTHWDINIGVQTADQAPNMSFTIQATGNPTITRLPVNFVQLGALNTQWPTDGTAVKVQVTLIDGSNNVIDEDIKDATWTGTQAVPEQLRQTSTGGGSGLTPTQALQLEQTHAATWVDQLVDALTTTPLAGDPNTGFVGINLRTPVFGVIVRMTQIAAGLEPDTPDGDYWVKTLAVVRVYRGQDLWVRAPIHTSSKLVNLWTEGLYMGLTGLVGDSWLGDLSLQVTFLPGCNGNVILMHVP